MLDKTIVNSRFGVATPPNIPKQSPYSTGLNVKLRRGIVKNNQGRPTSRYRPYYGSVNNESINNPVDGNRQHSYIVPNNATIQRAITRTNQKVPPITNDSVTPQHVFGSRYTTWNSTSGELEPTYSTPKRSLLGRVSQGVRNTGSGIGKFGIGLGKKVRSLFGRGGTRKLRKSGRKRTVKRRPCT
jgi:hypothetical protein